MGCCSSSDPAAGAAAPAAAALPDVAGDSGNAGHMGHCGGGSPAAVAPPAGAAQKSPAPQIPAAVALGVPQSDDMPERFRNLGTIALGITVDARRELHTAIRAWYVANPSKPPGMNAVFAGVGPLPGYAVNFYMKSNTHGQSYCEMLQSRGTPGVGWPDVFVSWALAADVEELAEAMALFCAMKGWDEQSACFWLCDTSFDQNSANAASRLEEIVSAVRYTAMHMHPLDSADPNPLTLRRVWCLLELLVTFEDGLPFELLLGAQEKLAVLEILKDHRKFKALTAGVDASKADAFHPADKVRVTGQIESRAGVGKLTRLVQEQLENVFVGMAQSHIQELSGRLGHNHRDTLRCKQELANLLRNIGQAAKAQPILEEAARECTVQLGKLDELTLCVKGELAMVLKDVGDLAGARQVGEEVARDREAILGPTHEGTLAAKGNLAVVLKKLGDLAGARQLGEEVVRDMEATLGPMHPQTLTSKGNLARVLCELGDFVAARRLEEEVLQAEKATHGDNHPSTIISKMNLAMTLKGAGEVAAARQLGEEAVRGQIETLGEEHPNTRQMRSMLNSIMAP